MGQEARFDQKLDIMNAKTMAKLTPEQLRGHINALHGELEIARKHSSPVTVLTILEDLTHAYRLLRLEQVQREQERVFNPPQDHLPKPF